MILTLNINHIKERGFGILGLIIAIMIISMASVVVIMNWNSITSTKGHRETENKASVLSGAIQQYRIHHADQFPALLDHLISHDGGNNCALDNLATSSTYLKLQGWCGPYLDVTFEEFQTDYARDGWGNLFHWNPSGVMTSCGPDQTCGSSDDLIFNQ